MEIFMLALSAVFGAVGGLAVARPIARRGAAAQKQYEAELRLANVIQGYRKQLARQHEQAFESNAVTHPQGYASVESQKVFTKTVLLDLPHFPEPPTSADNSVTVTFMPRPHDHADLLAYLRSQTYWQTAISNLRELHARRGADAAETARTYASVYEGSRAAMVYDVVASRRRRYTSVAARAAKFGERCRSLVELAAGDHDGHGLSADRWQTMRGLAHAFRRYRMANADLRDASDDVVVRHWANAVEPVRMAPQLDPFCGSVKGIGIALFAYLRARSGADAIKPDNRVRERMVELGFPAALGDRSCVLVAEAVAVELNVSRLHLDQLLWLRAVD